MTVINLFIREVQRSSPGYTLRVNYSNVKAEARLTGFFLDTVVGMLDASNHGSMGVVSTFIGAIP